MLSAEGLLVGLAVDGRLEHEELRDWLAAAGIGEQAAVLLFALSDRRAAQLVLERCLADADVRGLVGERDGLLCAIVDVADPLELVDRSRELVDWPRELVDWPRELAARVRSELGKRFGDVRAAASRPAPGALVEQGFREARAALQMTRSDDGNAPEVASYDDLGALKLLLALQPRQALQAYCEVVLGPVESEEHSYGEELLRSLDAFIEHNGHWERAAQTLYCHRHTLRYRIRRVEELTGRDLRSASDRIELWLALRGRELSR